MFRPDTTQNMEELSGDGPLRPADRLRYLLRNARRNLFAGGTTLKPLRFTAARLASTPGIASPGRALTDTFLLQELPRLLPPGPVRVLDIGCGRGHLTSMLAKAGYHGEYVGLDVDDRFTHDTKIAGFTRRFVHGSAHDFQPDAAFDLIVSVSALEHIPDDGGLLRRLSGMLAPHGLQLHIVPSGWGLAVYLWHGFRQYTIASVERRFGQKGTAIYSMGGLAGLVLHLAAITLPESLLGLPLRYRWPAFYQRLLDFALGADRYLPVGATMLAVTWRKPAAVAEAQPET